MTALLQVSELRAGYGAVRVLHGLDFSVERGEVVVILGANGAGKTTTLRALSGLIPARGHAEFDGSPVLGRQPEQLATAGIAHVPQGRGTIVDLTVDDNLHVGAYRRRGRDTVTADIELWYTTFPVLATRRGQFAGSMSGGEQQMLAIARAMMARPKLVLLDEPSLGLAPLVTRLLFETLGTINREQGVSLLVVEQNANLGLGIANRGYVLETGAIVTSGTAAELAGNDEVRRAYLGA